MTARNRTVAEQALLRLANVESGVLEHDDLLGAGLTRHQIAGWLASGRLTRLHPRVYALGHSALRDRGRWLAAVRWAGPACALSHCSASAYFDWTEEAPDEPVHLTTTRRLDSRPGVVVHRVRRLDPLDVFRAPDMHVTTMPRTLVDLADVLEWPAFRAVADGRRQVRLDSLREAQRRAPNRAGSPKVRRLLDADQAHTRSEFERRFLRFCTAHDLPRPDELNAALAGHTADCVYRALRLVVELDGRSYHRRRDQMRADRRRDVDYQLAGFRILRLVWDDLHPDEAARTATRVAAMLAV